MKIDRIHHVAYRCKDAKETVLWYNQMLKMDFVLAIALNSAYLRQASLDQFAFPLSYGMLLDASGNVLDANGVETLFEQLRGARPGLNITLSEFKGIALHPGGAVVSYRELQEEHNGNRTDRRATVVFEKDASGKLLWRHLHETFFAD